MHADLLLARSVELGGVHPSLGVLASTNWALALDPGLGIVENR